MRQGLSLARCDNRSVIARDHPVLGGPVNWAPPGTTIERRLAWLNFDFFIDWGSTETPVSNHLWLKIPVRRPFFDEIRGVEGEKIRELLLSESDFVQLVRFGKQQGFTISAIIFDDYGDFRSEFNAWIFTVQPEKKSFSCHRLTLGQLMGLIQKHSGGPVKVGSKGLMYGTSRLECFLSKTDAAWPGDVDALLVDSSANFEAKAIFEFKKCTNRARVAFCNERLGNYYPHPDKRKYDRLAFLGERLSADGALPIHIVFYSNQADERRLIFEIAELSGRSSELRVIYRNVYDIAPNNGQDVREIMVDHLKETVGII